DPTWSDFTYKGIFAPLVYRAARYVAGRGQLPGKTLITGQAAEISLGGAQWDRFSLQTPEQVEKRIRPEIRNGRYFFKIQDVQQEGFYRLLADGSLKFVWAANFDPAEIAQPPVEMKSLQQALGIEHIAKLPANVELEAALKRLRYGREIWKIFILIAFILILLEMLILRESNESKGGQEPIVQHQS
ncbi:MAG: hypothetical protein D6814_07865, partial [Calditrichaeota bacterium]